MDVYIGRPATGHDSLRDHANIVDYTGRQHRKGIGASVPIQLSQQYIQHQQHDTQRAPRPLCCVQQTWSISRPFIVHQAIYC